MNGHENALKQIKEIEWKATEDNRKFQHWQSHKLFSYTSC